MTTMYDCDVSSVADRLSFAIERSGLSYAEVAQRCEIDKATIGSWVSGKRGTKRGLNGSVALKLAKALDVDYEWLIDGGDYIRPGVRVFIKPADTLNLADLVARFPKRWSANEIARVANDHLRGIVPKGGWVAILEAYEAEKLAAEKSADD
jgi:transcriptional regulator with XRE-family HTH domain